MSRWDGPDCGVDGCQRERGHIGDHRRVEEITPRSIDRAAFGLVDDDGDGYGGRAPRHPGDCPATISYGHDIHTRGCVEYTPPPKSLREPASVLEGPCRECGHQSSGHASVTNDGCLVDGCMCELDEDRASDPASPINDLEDENADLRMTLAAASDEIVRLSRAIEDFILWWDMPPYVLDDDDGLRMEVDSLRAALDPTKVSSK